jgi:hypothetical protein
VADPAWSVTNVPEPEFAYVAGALHATAAEPSRKSLASTTLTVLLPPPLQAKRQMIGAKNCFLRMVKTSGGKPLLLQNEKWAKHRLTH